MKQLVLLFGVLECSVLLLMATEAHSVLHVHFKELVFVDSRTGWIGGEDGLYRTDDGGRSWTAQTYVSRSDEVGTVSGHVSDMDFVSDQIGWVLSTSYDYYGRQEFDLYATADGGTTWQKRELPGPSRYSEAVQRGFKEVHLVDAHVGALIVHDFYGDRMEASLLLTRDGGRSWIQNLIGEGQVDDVFFSTESEVWITGYLRVHTTQASDLSWVLKSTDGGFSWVEFVKAGSTPTPAQIAFSSPKNGTLVGPAETALDGRLWFSSDYGKTWQDRIFKRIHFWDVNFRSPSSGWIFGDELGYDDEGVKILDRLVAFSSANGGSSWMINRLPNDPHGVGFSPQVAFGLNEVEAWVVDSGTSKSWENPGDLFGKFRLLHTADGGRSWRFVYPANETDAEPILPESTEELVISPK